MATYFYVLSPKRIGVGGFASLNEARDAAAEAMSLNKDNLSAEVFSQEDNKIVLRFSGHPECRVLWKAAHE